MRPTAHGTESNWFAQIRVTLCNIKLAAREGNGRPGSGEPRETPLPPFYDAQCVLILRAREHRPRRHAPGCPTSQLNEVRRGRNAANVAGGSFVFSRPALRDHGWFKAKTASRVDGLKRRVWAGKLQRCKGNRASRACFVGTPAAVPGRRTLRAFGCWRAIQRCEWFGRFHLAAVRAGLGRYARALERACRWRSTARRHARARFW